MQQQIQYLPYKLGIVCPHDQAKANANYIDVACSLHQQIYHRVSQASKICNKCATLIMQTTNSVDYCPCCIEKLEQLIAESWICTHRERNLEQIVIKCLNNPKQTHEVPFRRKVCKMCYDKIRASFMFANSCVVCDQKQNELFENIEKTITKPSYYYFEQVIKQMQNKKFKQEQIKAEIQSYCLAEPVVKCDSKFKNQANKVGQNLQQYHQSKRYQLYPKCTKHRNNFIDLCNNCLVSILNLKCCPYGCNYQRKQTKVAKVESITNQTGFLCMYPKASKQYQYIQYFNVRHIQQGNKLDKWQSHLKKIKYTGTDNICNKFGLYSGCVQVNKSTYFYSGGVLGNKISQMKPTNKCFFINITDKKSFSIEDLCEMNEARANHGVVYFKDYVYVIGGYTKQKCLSSCQKFNLKTKKWQQMANLKIQRSKPNVLQYKGQIYALGGISNNQQIWENQIQKYNSQKNQWEIIGYKGYDVPFLTGATSLTKCWGIGQIDNLYLIGGSNYETSTYLVQEALIMDNKLKINISNIEQKLNFCRQSAAISLMKTDSEKQKIVIIFGGLLQHESFLSFDAVRFRIVNKQVSPIFVYDDVSTGSYRLILRQNSLSAYQYMANKLLQQGLLTKQKLENLQGEALLKSQANLYKVEKMWYGTGKCLIGYSGL